MQNVTQSAPVEGSKVVDPAKAARKAARKAEMKNAMDALRQFAQTEEFGKLPKGIQSAIARLSMPAKRTGGGSGSAGGSSLSLFRSLFPKVGAKVTELELFKATKKGRAEFKKLVRTTLRKVSPAERMWIQFDETAEIWTLVAVGEAAPKDWKGADPNANSSATLPDGEEA